MAAAAIIGESGDRSTVEHPPADESRYRDNDDGRHKPAG